MPGHEYDFIEIFAGVGRVAKTFRRKGLKAVALDLEYDATVSRKGSMDLTTPSGLVFFGCISLQYELLQGLWGTLSCAILLHEYSPSNLIRARLCILLILRGRRDSFLVMLAVCCSSWVLASPASTKRSVLTPMGYEGFEKVSTANLLASRQGRYEQFLV